MTESVALLLAYILDLLIGDPARMPHPVQAIGWVITKTSDMLREKIAGPSKRPAGREDGLKDLNYKAYLPAFLKKDIPRGRREKLAGLLLALIITGLTYYIFHRLSIYLLSPKSTAVAFYLASGVYLFLLATTIAARELVTAGKAVIQACRGSIGDARERLGMIVGRDTGSLDRKDICRALIETLSENASDGIIAPMFYFVIGGLPLAMAYKAVNTLDSMVGYKNKEYKNFGWASARLDDIANYVPARITGILIIAATFLISLFRPAPGESSECLKVRSCMDIPRLLKNIRRRFGKSNFIDAVYAFSTMTRDGKRHSSPNSGIPEAAMAGALGVRLGGPSAYEGVSVTKPYIGEDRSTWLNMAQYSVRPGSEACYLRASGNAVLIVKVTSVLGLFTALLIMYIF